VINPDGEPVPFTSALSMTREERLTAQFYAWERRGRGWQVWPYPVELEPPFRPFWYHALPPRPAIDDSRRPTAASRFVDGLFGRKRLAPALAPPDAEEEPQPEPVSAEGEYTELQLGLPAGTKVLKEGVERLFASLALISSPIAFEVIGVKDAITVQFACASRDRTSLTQQLAAHFPEAVIEFRTGYVPGVWDLRKPSVIVDFGLSRECMMPLRTVRGFDLDPLTAIAGALAGLGEGEIGIFQVLFQTARNPWAESIMRAVTDNEGRPFFADAPELLSQAREKVAHLLHAAVVRVGAQAGTSSRAWALARNLGGALAQFGTPSTNALVALTNDEYYDEDHAADLLARTTHRSGMLLNTEELVSLVHPPSASVRVPELRREDARTKSAPQIVRGHPIVLGENVHAGQVTPVTLSADGRVQHCYVIGASGTGKSTLLLNLILQDIHAGEGLAVLDPHGDLVDDILGRIPETRWNDVILFDPSDEEYPVGFNVLEAHSEVEKNLLGSDLVAVFRRLSTSWGDQMTSVLGNAVLAFLESAQGGTLVDLRRFLVDPTFRAQFLATVRDPEIVYYWQKSFPLLVGKPQGPILTRLDTFLRPKLIRAMVAQREQRFDLGRVMNEGKILLAKLSQGMIGEENAHLLGTLLVSKFHQLALSRQELAVSSRRPFSVFIDEFHHFVTPSMASILSGARKYRLGLVLAHQELQQLQSRDADVASAVMANPYTRICFRVGDHDAKRLAEGFSFFEARDLQNLKAGEAICRVERAEFDFNLRTFPLPEAAGSEATLCRKEIVARSRERYATRREDVVIPESQSVSPPAVQSAPPRATEPKDMPAQRVHPAGPPSKRGPVSDPIRPDVPGRTLRDGNGGAQHKYLQDIVRRWAASKGWKATIEKQILDGLGSVDVALERGGESVACEISVSTGIDHEIGNIRKCLAADFAHVALVLPERKALARAKDAVRTTLSEEESKRVRVLTPEELFEFLDTLDAQGAAREENVRGYKVKVKYRAVGDAEEKARKQAISDVILGALKKLKTPRK
jgi:Type IV secretion-system coupling protein DNA-binding domain